MDKGSVVKYKLGINQIPLQASIALGAVDITVEDMVAAGICKSRSVH
jgi:hypothetical protein